MNKALLSLCIPTYNRAAILKENILVILHQLEEIEGTEVELIVSDNCSTDNTQEVIKLLIEAGAPIVYNRNEENLGSAGNFIKCIKMASGKYIQLLGDDDYLAPGGLKYILDCLRGKEYGLLHIDPHPVTAYPLKEYFDNNDYLKIINRQFTWMSGNIFRSDIVSKIDYRKYTTSHLMQMPFYLESALESNVNAITGETVIEMDAGQKYDAKNRGGSYNFIGVFAFHFLRIMREFINKHKDVDNETYRVIKRKMYEDWISKFIKNQLFKVNRKTPVNWFYALKCYGFEGYFYKSLFSLLKK